MGSYTAMALGELQALHNRYVVLPIAPQTVPSVMMRLLDLLFGIEDAPRR